MKVLIVDDESLARQRLCDLLEEIGDELEIVGEASSGQHALSQVKALSPDVVLLDIQMPEINGLEVAMHLARLETPPAVIFTTAYGEHALKAFEANAIDYLLKPVRRDRLEQALAKAQRPFLPTLQAVAQEHDHQTRQHICAHHRGGLKLIPIEEVIFFHSDNKYVSVHHLNGEVLIDDPLKSLEQEFADRFTRVHRNALVANDYIEALEKNSEGQHVLRLRHSEQRIEISRRQLPAVRKIIAELGQH